MTRQQERRLYVRVLFRPNIMAVGCYCRGTRLFSRSRNLLSIIVEREVRLVGRLLVPVTLSILGLLVACFGLAVALELTTPASLLDAYLATTPGGLYAVLAVAFGAGANTTFIIAVQGLRVLVMVLAAPAVVRLLLRGQPPATSRRRNTR